MPAQARSGLTRVSDELQYPVDRLTVIVNLDMHVRPFRMMSGSSSCASANLGQRNTHSTRMITTGSLCLHASRDGCPLASNNPNTLRAEGIHFAFVKDISD